MMSCTETPSKLERCTFPVLFFYNIVTLYLNYLAEISHPDFNPLTPGAAYIQVFIFY